MSNQESDRDGASTPDFLTWLLPPLPSSAAAKKTDEAIDVSRRTDGGMHYFVPLMKMIRVAAIVAAMGTTLGLALLAIVYFSSLVEGRVISSVNEANRAADASVNAFFNPNTLLL